MQISRREFNKLVPAGLLGLSLTGSLIGCGSDPLGAYLTTGKAAFDSLAALLVSKGILQEGSPLIQDVDAAFSAAEDANTAYNNNKSAGSSQLAAALAAINQALQAFLAQADIPTSSGLVTIVLDAIEIILSTIAGYLNSLPNPAPVPSILTAKSGHAVTVIPKKRSLSQFKTDWNRVVASQPSLLIK
jgi:hypothetical protein